MGEVHIDRKEEIPYRAGGYGRPEGCAEAEVQYILIAASMDPEKTIVLLKKTKVKWLPRSWVE